MDFLFFVVLIFIVISWIGGAAGKAAKSSGKPASFGGYQKTNTGYSRTNSGETSVQRQGSAGQDWISQLQNLESKLTQATRGSTGKSQLRPGASGRSNVQNRFNNSPMAKSTFNDHSDSKAFLMSEMTESRDLWAMNHQDMDRINQDFRSYVNHQHQENQRMMQDARRLDR